jgi:lipoprotein-anchoring transpeptidase ErfK/SrfK
MDIPISTGLELTPTPRGEFKVYLKTPTRYMQGPLPGISNQYYDLPGVPWNLYFTKEGAVIHGAYWHQSFGKPYSHGCVNVDPLLARTLYEWTDLGTSVVVRD